MPAFKVVARHRAEDKQPTWSSKKKQGTQACKKIYITQEKFDKHSPELIRRWGRWWDIEIYTLVEEEWELYEK